VDGRDLRLEAHLLDFEGDLYDTHLKLDLVYRLRDEAKFESLDQLKHQITTDVDKAKSLLHRRESITTRR
jgi:riboflavin kinase/FMN adenylyltransferase